ncbi:MAG: hypothetical protein AABW68_02450, partial [archaeon]
NGTYTLQASAPYHLTRQISVAAQSARVDNANVSFTFSFPTIGFVGEPVIVAVSGCSYEDFPLTLNAELADFSAEGYDSPPPEPWTIPAGSCSDAELVFTPPAVAEDLSFKIRVFTPTRVLAEKGGLMEILPSEEDGVI